MGERRRDGAPRGGAHHARWHLGGTLHPGGAYAGQPGQNPDDVPAPPAVRAPAKKKALHASEQDTPRGPQLRAVEPYTYIEESGLKLAMTRLLGFAPRGAGEGVSAGGVDRHRCGCPTLVCSLWRHRTIRRKLL